MLSVRVPEHSGEGPTADFESADREHGVEVKRFTPQVREASALIALTQQMQHSDPKEVVRTILKTLRTKVPELLLRREDMGSPGDDRWNHELRQWHRELGIEMVLPRPYPDIGGSR